MSEDTSHKNFEEQLETTLLESEQQLQRLREDIRAQRLKRQHEEVDRLAVHLASTEARWRNLRLLLEQIAAEWRNPGKEGTDV